MNKKNILASIIGLAALLVASFFIFGITDTLAPSATIDGLSEKTNPATASKPTGELKIEDITVGTGESAVKKGDTILIHYSGTLTDGTKFDSSYDRGEPFETVIGSGAVIKGWDEGVPGMKIGGKRRLTIPAHLAYGEEGRPPTIPQNATLVFEVELVDIK